MFTKSRIVRTKAEMLVIAKRNREMLLFDKRAGKNKRTYPMSVPIAAVKNHFIPFVYKAQVKSRRQMERYDEKAKTRSLFF